MEQSRVKICVSSCLLGEAVRYDGTAIYQPMIVERLADRFELVSFCPEVGIGMAVPRPPIQRVMVGGQVRLLRAEDPSFDLTDKMYQLAQQSVEQLSDIGGFILKSRSPSCGLSGVKLFNEERTLMARGEGAFAEVIRKAFSKLPMVEECDLTNQQQIDRFAEQVEHYSRSVL